MIGLTAADVVKGSTSTTAKAVANIFFILNFYDPIMLTYYAVSSGFFELERGDNAKPPHCTGAVSQTFRLLITRSRGREELTVVYRDVRQTISIRIFHDDARGSAGDCRVELQCCYGLVRLYM
jgi:hypothetical protein